MYRSPDRGGRVKQGAQRPANNQVDRGDCDVVNLKWSETRMRDINITRDEDK